MKKFARIAMVVFILATGAVHAGEKAHWGYTGAEAPEYWGKLSPEFTMCSIGKNQSPINLTSFTDAELQPVGIHYHGGGNEIINNGHSVQINYQAGSKISLDGMEFELKQYHFHTPSENLINDKSYPMEVHLVHADKDENLAVAAVMFEEGEENKSIAQAWERMPEKAGIHNELPSIAAAEGLLPEDQDYYRFNGSLTTPPCTEGVRWIVMKKPVTASKEQIDTFSKVMGHPNNRPIQPINARQILQ
jgi:carbonic anhydrase